MPGDHDGRLSAEIRMDELHPVTGRNHHGGVMPWINEATVVFHDQVRIHFPEAFDQFGEGGACGHLFGESVYRDGDQRLSIHRAIAISRS